MICYRDRTYCASDCTDAACERNVTPATEAEASRAGLPIARADLAARCGGYRATHVEA